MPKKCSMYGGVVSNLKDLCNILSFWISFNFISIWPTFSLHYGDCYQPEQMSRNYKINGNCATTKNICKYNTSIVIEIGDIQVYLHFLTKLLVSFLESVISLCFCAFQLSKIVGWQISFGVQWLNAQLQKPNSPNQDQKGIRS